MEKRKSPMRVDFWMAKGLSQAEAEYRIRSQRKINKEYWMLRGFTEQEALLKISEFQKEMSARHVKKRKDNPEEYIDKYPVRLDYWIKRTSTMEEAVLAFKKSQSTFSLDKCIKKYGDVEGRKVWSGRQAKWQKKLNDKSPEEIAAMNAKKDSCSFYFCLRQTDGDISAALKLRQKKIIARTSFIAGKSSKEAFRCFLPLYRLLRNSGISRNNVYIGAGKCREFFIFQNDKIMFYDFTIRNKKIIVEYNGSRFHADPRVDESDRQKWKSIFGKGYNECLKYDEHKKMVAEKMGFSYFVIWDFYTEKEKALIFKNVLDLL